METLHKLAGVQDTSDLSASQPERPSQPTIHPEPPPIPDHTESPSLSQRASRVSLPLNRQPSHKSFRSSKSKQGSRVDLSDYPPTPRFDPHAHAHSGEGGEAGQQGAHSVGGSASGDEEGEEDFPWGPSHPCFPHPNPHCAVGSEEARSTRVIRVKRDWLAAGDLYPQFANLYPEILDPLVSDTEFRFLVTSLNGRLKRAFDPFGSRAWVDAVVGVLTGFVWEDVGATGPKRGMKGLEAFVEEWNRGRGTEGREVRLVQPRRTGFMGLDFVVPDPGIEVGGEEEGRGEE